MGFSQISAVLFDLDGTLVHSAPDMAAAANWLRAKRGLDPLDENYLAQFVSRGGAGVIGAAFPDASESDGEQLLDQFLTRYGNHVSVHSCLFPGVARLLQVLESQPWPWGIVTNKAAVYAEPLLTSLAIRCRASALICGDTLPRRKPEPDGLLAACGQLDVAPERCVYVGDDQRDIQAARAAGCPAVAAAYGYFTPDDQPDSWGADAIIHRADELLDVLAIADRSGDFD